MEVVRAGRPAPGRSGSSGVDLERRPAYGLREGRVRVRGCQRDQHLHGAGMADGPDLVEQGGDGALDGRVEMADQQRGLAVVGDGRRGVDPEPGGLLAGEDVGRVLGVRAVVLGEPEQRVGRTAGSALAARTSASAGAPTTRSASKASPRRSASAPRATARSSVTALPTGRAASQARYSARAGPG